MASNKLILLYCIVMSFEAVYTTPNKDANLGGFVCDGRAIKLLDSAENEDGIERLKKAISDTNEGYDHIHFEVDLSESRNGSQDKRKVFYRRYKRRVLKATQFWEDGVIPFKEIRFSDQSITTAIRRAMKHWEDVTCIRFVPYHYKRFKSFLTFKAGSSCRSNIGMLDSGSELELNANCASFSTVVHELGHIIGWIHEHQRPDRNNYITVNWQLISQDYWQNYYYCDESYIVDYDVPYDYLSVMHYREKGNYKIKDQRFIGKLRVSDYLSFYDRKLANLMYSCSKSCDRRIVCQEPAFKDQHCNCICPDGVSECTMHVISLPMACPGYRMNISESRSPSNAKAECNWVKMDNKKLPRERNDLSLTGLTEVECKLACLEECRFLCKSFEYNSHQCILSKEYLTLNQLDDEYQHSYFQRPFCSLSLTGIKTCGWKAYNGQLLSNHNSKTIANSNINKCRLACWEELSFDCRSFDYNHRTGYCYLSRFNQHMTSNRKLDNYPRMVYVERIYCL